MSLSNSELVEQHPLVGNSEANKVMVIIRQAGSQTAATVKRDNSELEISIKGLAGDLE